MEPPPHPAPPPQGEEGPGCLLGEVNFTVKKNWCFASIKKAKNGPEAKGGTETGHLPYGTRDFTSPCNTLLTHTIFPFIFTLIPIWSTKDEETELVYKQKWSCQESEQIAVRHNCWAIVSAWHMCTVHFQLQNRLTFLSSWGDQTPSVTKGQYSHKRRKRYRSKYALKGGKCKKQKTEIFVAHWVHLFVV